MKKRLLALLTVLLLAVLMTAVVSATASMTVVPATGVDINALDEGNTFDVYIVISPFAQIGATKNYIYRVPEDTTTGAPSGANANLTALRYTLTWDKASLEVAEVGTFGTYPTSANDTRDAGNGYTYAYLAQLNSTGNAKVVAVAEVTGVGSGTSNTGTLVINYDNTIAAIDNGSNDAKVAGFFVRNQSSAPNGNVVVAKVTFRVVAGAEGGQNLPITLENKYTTGGTPYTKNATNVTVSVEAGCAHENKTALTPEQLASAGLENATVSCLKEGVTWYYCADCDKNISINTNKLDHNYTIEGYVKAPTCANVGTKAMFCSVDEECTAHDPATETKVDPLGHDFSAANHVYLEPSCTDDGYDAYWCTRCYRVSAEVNGSLASPNHYFVTDGFYDGIGDSKNAVEIPDGVKLAALGHDWKFDRTVEGVSYYVCARECGVEEKEVSVADTVRYVSTSGGGDGSSATSTVTLAQAFDAFKDMPAGADCTIYLVGKVELASRQVSSSNTSGKSFEETKHEATVTITTAPGATKGELHFPYSSVSMYFLYGPTVFDNIKVSSSTAGTTAGTSASTTIFARGFELTMTENFETISSGNGIPYSKADGSFSAATDVTLTIPDSKLYLAGGFAPNGFFDGGSKTTIDVTMNIYGGTYWVVSGAARNTNINAEDSVININVGGKAVIGQLIPISTTSGCNADGTVVNIHYYSGFTAATVSRAQGTTTEGDYTVNHFFHSGSGDIKIGDFLMGSASPKNVNCYYTTVDADATAMAEAFITKGDENKYTYQETQENLPFYAWCVVHGGGHTVGSDGICTFCETVPKSCKTHTTETIVLSEPTCIKPGESYKRCTVCYETVGDIIYTTDSEAHNIDMNINTTPYIISCTLCSKIIGTYSGENTGVYYVSDNGYGDGGFSPEYPLNNFETAMKLAAKYNGDATIYVMDTITVASNTNTPANNSTFSEPAHTNHITVAGYKNIGVVKQTVDNGGKMVYSLSGAVTFENIEFSSAVVGGTFYMVANHNHLTFGENVTTDFMRTATGGVHGGTLEVIGGCYRDHVSSSCTKKTTHLTFYSGNIYELVCGSVERECGLENGTITVELLGDISIRDFFIAGSYRSNAGDVNITVDGNISSGNTFSIAGDNSTSNRTIGTVKDVTLTVLGGTISSNNFQSSDKASTARPLGATSQTPVENGAYDITYHLDSLTICYDPSNSSARHTALRFNDTPHSKTIVYKVMDDTYCEVNANGAHTKGETVEEIGSTCAKQGYGIYVCEACNKEYTVALDAVAHTLGTAEVATAANCINPEIMKEVCSECGFIQYSIGDEGATGEHDFGEEGDVCVYCSQSRQDLCEHVWDNGVAISTGCGTGVQYTCTNGCGKTMVEVTSTSHNFGKYTVTVEPTETGAGVKTRTCKSCGKVETALVYADGSAVNNEAIAVDANGALADVEIATSKLTKAEKAAIDALLQETAYGSEVKVSYDVDGNVTGITYSIPLPAEYANMTNLQVVVKDDDGTLHVVDFTIEKGYIVFTF